MTDDQPTSEHIDFTDQDVEDLRSLGVTTGDEPQFHPILEVWREVLKPAHTERDGKVTPQYANKIVSGYHGIEFVDMNVFRDRYYSKVIDLEKILHEVIESDDQCLLASTPEEDREMNSKHYRTVLLEWQKQFLTWELEWDTTDPLAGVEMGSVAEVHKMFFSEMGIVAYLQNIQFQFTEQDQAEIAEALQALKDGDGE